MVRRIRHGASAGLLVWMTAGPGGPAAAQVPPGPGTAVAVAVGSDAAPGELQAWDARIDGMIRTGQLVVMSRVDDPTLADRTHEYATQFVGGVPVLGAGVTRQFANGVTVSAFGTLHEGLGVNTAPGITAGEAGAHLERQTGARLAGGQTPELMVLPLPTGSYVLAYGGAFDDGRYHFASAADGGLVHSIDAFRSQSAIGTGLGILGDRKKVSTVLNGGRFEAHDMLRPGEIVTLDIGFDEEQLDRLAAPGPWSVRRWTSQDIAADADNDWPDTAVVDGHAHMGWTYDYFARQHGWHGVDGRRGRIIGIVNAFDGYNAFAAPPPFGPEGRGVYAFGQYTGPEAPNGEPLVALHVVAHELTHGVVFYSVAQRTGSPFGLIDAYIEGESLTLGPRSFTDEEGVTHACRTTTFRIRALTDAGDVEERDFPAYCSDDGRFWLASRQGGAANEALADIFGVSTGFFHESDGATGSYELGIDSAGGAIRSLSNPRGPFYPRDYRDRLEFAVFCAEYVDGECFGSFAGVIFIRGKYLITIDGCCYGGEHLNSTILSHAFYLAVEGGTNLATGHSVEGVGPANRELIEKIFFRGLTVHMPMATTLPRTAAVLRQAAADLHPPGSAPYRAVHQALRAAGF